MKLTIDTKHDSKEEIQQAIDLLSSLVGDSSKVYTNSADNAATSNPMANIFGTSEPSTPSSEESSSAASAFGNMFGPSEPVQSSDTPESEEEGEDETPAESAKIIPYE